MHISLGLHITPSIMVPLVIMRGKEGAQDILSAILNHTESGFLY